METAMQTWEEAARSAGWSIFIDLPSRTEFRHLEEEDDFVTDLKGEAAWKELCDFMRIAR
jgi:hypothetical protein